MKIDPQQTATILAALRNWQLTLSNIGMTGSSMVPQTRLGDFADHFNDEAPLTIDEIDTLCDALNSPSLLPTPQHLALLIIGDIVRDPRLLSCSSFVDLHRHCDANTLGGMDTLFTSGLDQTVMSLLTEAQEIVNTWLQHRPAHVELPITWDSDNPEEDPVLWIPPWLSFIVATPFDRSEEDTGRGDPVGPAHITLLEAGNNHRFPAYTESR